MEFVREVIHDATQTLSDHLPCLIRIVVQPETRTGSKNSSYYKLHAIELEVESTKAALRKVWLEHMIEGQDSRVNWELGWRAIRSEVKKISKTREEATKYLHRPQDQLYELRLAASLALDTTYSERLKELEVEVRRREIIGPSLAHS